MPDQTDENKIQPIGYWTGEAYRRIAGAIRKSLAAEGLTQPQWWTLNHVANGEWTRGSLVEKLAPFSANEQGLEVDEELDGLLERGWVTHDASTEKLSLTTTGEEHRQRAWERNRATHRAMLDGVSDAEYDDCISVLQRVVGNLGGDPSPH